jgi:hypothetical protein
MLYKGGLKPRPQLLGYFCILCYSKNTFGPRAAYHLRMERASRLWRTTMNPLALIKQQLEKAARLREAQHASLVYRGVAYAPKPH